MLQGTRLVFDAKIVVEFIELAVGELPSIVWL